MTDSNTKKAAPRTEVKLLKPHTHAGVFYDSAAVKEGVTISITEKQKSFLKPKGVIA